MCGEQEPVLKKQDAAPPPEGLVGRSAVVRPGGARVELCLRRPGFLP